MLKRAGILRRSFKKNRMSGAGLIEVLVAVLIAAVGLLALAGANAAATRYTKFAQYRGVATMLAQDITDRMRANNVSTTTTMAYTFNTSDFSTQLTAPTAPSPMCDVVTDTCTTAQIAAVDLYQWRLAVRNTLPSGAVFLDPDSVNAKAADLWIAWREGDQADDEYASLSALDCPNDLAVSTDKAVRCLYFRIQL